jgi:hypothetical protein
MMTKGLAYLSATHRASERGQTLVFVALVFVILLGFAGLAVDVSSALSTRRFERSVADAASLAGAQDLQTSKSKAVTGQQRIDARTHALMSVVNQLKATSTGSCNPTSDISDCPLPDTPYRVSIKTPAPTCLVSTCDADANHSVQVAVHNPAWSTAFARLFGQPTWDVGITSVAGLVFANKYAVITLQPPAPKPNLTDGNLCKDLNVNGTNTILKVVIGDIGTNTSAATTLSGLIVLNDGDYPNNPYFIDHFDDISSASCGTNTNPTWSVDSNGNPPGKKIDTLIQDPNYAYAQFPGAPRFQDEKDAASKIPCSDPSVQFPTDLTTTAFLTPQAGGTLTCYKKGVYEKPFTVSNKDIAYLMPGAYSFLGGMKVDSILAGGMVNGQPGVVLVFPQVGGPQFLANNSNSVIVLNTGSYSCTLDSCRATAAVDFAGNLMKTATDLVLTVEVQRAAAPNACFSGTNPDNTNCRPVQNHIVKFTAGKLVQIAGVIYGPSDNMNITGGSSQTGFVGQIVSWSVVYTGGSTLSQSYPGALGNGILRLDRACSGPGTACSP